MIGRMSDIVISYDRKVEIKEYITINGRRARIHYNDGYMYSSWPSKNGTVAVHRIVIGIPAVVVAELFIAPASDGFAAGGAAFCRVFHTTNVKNYLAVYKRL